MASVTNAAAIAAAARKRVMMRVPFDRGASRRAMGRGGAPGTSSGPLPELRQRSPDEPAFELQRVGELTLHLLEPAGTGAMPLQALGVLAREPLGRSLGRLRLPLGLVGLPMRALCLGLDTL